MIASPSDVATERQVAREVIHEWNAIHSEDTATVLMPVGWETHSSPVLGDRAQEIINKHVLRGCDLLVAMFWTRIGSPTGNSPSGTVEEIREHIAEGKPAMIYFSSAPVRPDSVNDEQYNALKEFRSECYSMGLVETYDSISEFREKFVRQLAQTVIRHFKSDSATNAVTLERVPIRPQAPDMSDDAKELLLAAAEDPNGNVLKVRTFDGTIVKANKRQFVSDSDPRTSARWEGVLAQLVRLELLEPRGSKNEVFALTHKGYEVADLLRQQG